MMGRAIGWGAVWTFTMTAGVAAAQDQQPPPPPPSTTSTETAPPPPPPATTTAPPAETHAGSALGTSGEWGGLYNGRTLGSGGGGVFASGGYPGFSAGVLFGIIDKIDIGAVVMPVYNPAYELTNRGGGLFTANFGMGLLADARFQIISNDTISALVRIEPGVKFLNFNPGVLWGVVVNPGFDLGIKVMKGGTVYLGLEVPLFFGVDVSAGFYQIPILAGGGFEYHVNDFIALGGRFNGGPSIAITSIAGTTITDTEFAMIAEAFFMFRWDRVK